MHIKNKIMVKEAMKMKASKKSISLGLREESLSEK